MHNRETFGIKKRIPRDPSIQILPTLGPKVCKHYLHWAIWIPRGLARVAATGADGSVGNIGQEAGFMFSFHKTVRAPALMPLYDDVVNVCCRPYLRRTPHPVIVV